MSNTSFANLKRSKAERVGFGRWNYVVAAAMLLTATTLQFFTANATLNRLDGIAYDAKLTLAPPIQDSLANIQIIDIDERSLLEVERMPWRRNLFAELTHKLSELGALVIVYDVLFSEPQPNPAEPVVQYVLEAHDIPLDVDATIGQFDYDQLFAQSIARTDV